MRYLEFCIFPLKFLAFCNNAIKSLNGLPQVFQKTTFSLILKPLRKFPLLVLSVLSSRVESRSSLEFWQYFLRQLLQMVYGIIHKRWKKLSAQFEVWGEEYVADLLGSSTENRNINVWLPRAIDDGVKFLQALSEFFQMRMECAIDLQFIRTDTEFDKLVMSFCLTTFSFLHRGDGPCRSANSREACNQRLKIVQETPETVCFIAANEGQHAFNTVDLISPADQFSRRLKGDQYDKKDQREDTDRNPRHCFASAALVLHLAPASVEPLLAPSVERDWQEGKAT